MKKALGAYVKSEGHETPNLRDIPPGEFIDDFKKIAPATAFATHLLLTGTPTAEAAPPPTSIEDILNESTPDIIAEIINQWDSKEQSPLSMEQLIETLERRRLEGLPDEEGDVKCLAKNMWYEAANQPIEGQKAVAIVTLLRMISGKYPRSACGVVYQGWNSRAAQFSWTLEDHKRNAESKSAKFKYVTELAEQLHKLKDQPETLAVEATRLGLTSDTLFYKRHDWDKDKMSEQNAWFWKECVETVKDATGKDLQIGDHVFFRAKNTICKRPTTGSKKR